MLRLKHYSLMVISLLCLLALPVMAQEAAATEAAAAGTSSNISTLIILFGLGMIVLVGGRMYMKEHANNGKEID